MDLSIPLSLALGAEAFLLPVLEIMYIIGLWKVFTKCGLAGWHALIPFYHDYNLGEIANMKSEGMLAIC